MPHKPYLFMLHRAKRFHINLFLVVCLNIFFAFVPFSGCAHETMIFWYYLDLSCLQILSLTFICHNFSIYLFLCAICFQCILAKYLFVVFFIFRSKGLSKHWLAVKLQVVLSILSILISMWLAYVMYFIQQNLCVICAALFAVNNIIVILTIIRHQQLQQHKPLPSTGTTKKKAPAKKGRSKKD